MRVSLSQKSDEDWSPKFLNMQKRSLTILILAEWCLNLTKRTFGNLYIRLFASFTSVKRAGYALFVFGEVSASWLYPRKQMGRSRPCEVR